VLPSERAVPWRSSVDSSRGACRNQLDRDRARFSIRDFDISPDGRELVLEGSQEYSDIVLIQREAR
jgi:hypothetical protein